MNISITYNPVFGTISSNAISVVSFSPPISPEDVNTDCDDLILPIVVCPMKHSLRCDIINSEHSMKDTCDILLEPRF